jgi:pyridinium-3,5-biscarboxylic acid mononucleotide synthase
MDKAELAELLAAVADGTVTPSHAADRLSRLPWADLGFARVDHHRALRQGLPEAVYAPGKSVEHCVAIVTEMLENGSGPVVVTRTDADQRTALLDTHPGAIVNGATLTWRPMPGRDLSGPVLIVTAGTADHEVAEECRAVLAAYGIEAKVLADCGVAGIHRLLDHLADLSRAIAVVAIAGMEGALASVIGGLVACPVVAVPTSAGYGSGLEGVTALLAMTASCAPGVTVVGIDNGYGAAVAVARYLSA